MTSTKPQFFGDWTYDSYANTWINGVTGQVINANFEPAPILGQGGSATSSFSPAPSPTPSPGPADQALQSSRAAMDAINSLPMGGDSGQESQRDPAVFNLIGQIQSGSPSLGGPGSMGAFGTTPNMGFPDDFSLGSTPPSPTTDYLGVPGYSGPAYDPGSMGSFSATPNFGFPSGNMDWGTLPSSSTSYLGIPGYYDPSYSGSGSMGSFGTTPNFGFPSDFGLGSTPSSTYSYMGIPGSYDPTLTPDSSGAGFPGSGALPYTDPTPIPFSDPISSSVGGDMSLGGYSTTPTGAAGMQFQTDPSAGGTIGDFSYTPRPGLNTYDAVGGTTYVYDSDWNYLYTTTAGSTGSSLGTTASAPFAGAASTQQSAGGGIAGGSGATGGIIGGAGAGGLGGGITPAGYYSQFGPGATYSYPTGLGLGGLSPATGGYMSVGGGLTWAGSAVKPIAVAEGGDPAAGLFDSGRGAKLADRMGTTPDALAAAYDQTVMARSAAQPHQYPLTYGWTRNPGSGSSFSQKGVGFGQTKVDQSSLNAAGWWTPLTWTTDPSLAVPPPTRTSPSTRG